MATRLMALLLLLCMISPFLLVIAGQYDYDEVLRKSILFYEAQRSGKLPASNRIRFRGDSALGDKGKQGQDLTGGWYDAGDHVKFGFLMAISTTTLAWGILEFRSAYEAAGEYNNALDSIRWPLDYFIKCHVSDNEFYGQVGDGNTDHDYWGRPEDMTMARPAWSINASAPGSDLAGETAAAFAASYLVFKSSNLSYANTLLNHSRRLYNFAYNNRGLYSQSISNADAFYSSSEYKDELAWGAAWLYRATGEQQYLDRALEFASTRNVAWAYVWGDKTVGYQLLLASTAGQTSFQAPVEKFLRNWFPGGTVTYTPKGFAWRAQWGSNRYAANAAFIALVAAKYNILASDAEKFARSQIHYMLGDGGRSYVVGFGNNPPQHIHHRSSSCPDRPSKCDWNDFNRVGPNYQILYGALVGGPDQNDSYQDVRGDYVKNEVATDYNAGFQGAVAGLRAIQLRGQYNYDEVLKKSILFYEAQRSGKLPASNRIPYRGDSALGDKGRQGQDLTGGWYDAGDHVKFGFTMAISTTTLAWGILEFRSAYEAAGEYNNALDSIRWPLDYFIKCHVSDNEFYGQVGDGNTDHDYWGRPEDMTMARPAWSINASAPGSDLAGETAAAFAASYLVFKSSNVSYANTLLNHSRRLYNFAYNNRGIYSQSISNAGSFYSSSGYNDELAWGAAWLYRATGEQQYLNRSLEFASTRNVAWAYDWDDKTVGYQLLLASTAGQTSFQAPVKNFLRNWFPNGTVTYTPKGFAWRAKWGSNRYAANAAFIALVAAKYNILASDAEQFARSQIHYMLGDGGRSYVVGFGNNSPQRPHHRSSSCPDRPSKCDWNDFNRVGPNYQILYGALVGGPDQNDSYQDVRGDYVKNEVATDYNAGFQGAVAGLRAIQLRGQYDYDEVLKKSILFYEAQRSGKLPASNRIPYRGDSALGDKGRQGQDLTGGWYDAGDHVKFGFPMAVSTTTLAWGILEFRSAYEAAGEYNNALDSIRWPLDYFIKCHVSDNEFYGQVGDGNTDHAWWGRAEDMTMARPAWSINASAPGSDLAGETAAAFAASYLVFKSSNLSYANTLLNHSRRLYNFAYNNRGIYSQSISNAAAFYSSSGYKDELAWGAAWLYRATGEQQYLNRSLEFASKVDVAWAYDWSDKTVGYQLLLASTAGQSAFQAPVKNFLRNWFPGGTVTYTPKGLAWRAKWGSNRYAANAAFIALVAAKYNILASDAEKFARSQIHYMLGDSGRSYVVGFGNNPPQHIHHSTSSCPDRPSKCDWDAYNRAGPNYQILYGALVGGPDQNDSYQDVRSDYVKNEVATDYNAGFQGAVAGLRAIQLRGK